MTTSDFEKYSQSYRDIRLDRHGGILEVTFGVDQTLIWTAKVREEVARVFTEIANDVENKIIIITGIGERFWTVGDAFPESDHLAGDWGEPSLLEILMKVPVPVIAAINGPVHYYCEIPLISDVVLAAENVEFLETPSNVVQSISDKEVRRIVLHSLLGPNRTRHFLLVGKSISAKEAKKVGLVAEILRRKDLLNRAREIAFMLTRRPAEELRQIRMSFLQKIKREVDESLGGLRIWNAEDRGSIQTGVNNSAARSIYGKEETPSDVIESYSDLLSGEDSGMLASSISKKNESLEDMEERLIDDFSTDVTVDLDVNSDVDSNGEVYDGFSLHGEDIDKLAEDTQATRSDSIMDDVSVASEELNWDSESKDVVEADDRQNIARVIKSVSAKDGENDVKLNLAKAYIELGYYPSAQFILEEIMEEGDADQAGEAKLLKEQIGPSQS